ncbi:unnamed protein product [Paramecium pentaurelia]|uniref:Uncharacterized protein n=1 Tax=Paramecium pentaurelia TaxID=43138 RepID=A0A8S1TAF2_9CILI|nr:unnamed protein product [Paramecium pentaurelia]
MEERIKLKLAILQIQKHYTFDEVLFLERAKGVDKDYYIAKFPLKKFYRRYSIQEE